MYSNLPAIDDDVWRGAGDEKQMREIGDEVAPKSVLISLIFIWLIISNMGSGIDSEILRE